MLKGVAFFLCRVMHAPDFFIWSKTGLWDNPHSHVRTQFGSRTQCTSGRKGIWGESPHCHLDTPLQGWFTQDFISNLTTTGKTLWCERTSCCLWSPIYLCGIFFLKCWIEKNRLRWCDYKICTGTSNLSSLLFLMKWIYNKLWIKKNLWRYQFLGLNSHVPPTSIIFFGGGALTLFLVKNIPWISREYSVKKNGRLREYTLFFKIIIRKIKYKLVCSILKGCFMFFSSLFTPRHSLLFNNSLFP